MFCVGRPKCWLLFSALLLNWYLDMFDCIKCSMMDAQILMDACGYQHDFHVLELPCVWSNCNNVDLSMQLPLRDILHKYKLLLC